MPHPARPPLVDIGLANQDPLLSDDPLRVIDSCAARLMAIEYRTEPEYQEYLDGVRYPKVSPRNRHGLIQGEIFAVVRALGMGRGTASVETDAILKRSGPGRTKLIPDVSFISNEQYDAHPRSDWDEPPFSPEIAIEVKSPGDGAAFLRAKFARYLQTGSKLVLDVDPKTRTIVAHAIDDIRSFADGETFEHPAVPWLRFALRDVFAILDRFEER
jgi:Uma2 family endonuclease